MYLLDTNHCSRLLAGDPRIQSRIAALSDINVATSVIAAGELVYMAEKSERRLQNLLAVDAFLQDIRLYYVDDGAARVYGELKAALVRHFGPRDRSRRHKVRVERIGIGENDLWMAAIAVRHGLTIVSTDSDFARIEEAVSLSVEDWLNS